MRYLYYILIAAVSGAALVLANPTNQIGKLLEKAGLLEGMIERYSVNLVNADGTALQGAASPPPAPSAISTAAPTAVPAATPTQPHPPTPKSDPRNPQIVRLSALIENLNRQNKNLKLKIQDIEANRLAPNTLSADSKKIQREIDANIQRITVYEQQLATAIEREKASQ